MEVNVMTYLALALVAVQLMTVALAAVRLARRRRREPDTPPRFRRLVPVTLLATSVLPLAPLLAFNASTVFWGLWGAGYIAAALVYARADSARDLPRKATTPPAGTTGAD
jgi:hypothetical protein